MKKISPQVRAELELRGVDSVRMLLGVMSGDTLTGTARNTAVQLGNAKATRGEMEDWLKAKEATNRRWIVVGAVAAIAAAVFSLFAWLLPLK